MTANPLPAGNGWMKTEGINKTLQATSGYAGLLDLESRWPERLNFFVMPRTRSLAIILLAVVLSVAGLVYGLVVAHQRKAKLCWQGKPLEYWFNQLNDREIVRSPTGAVGRYGPWPETPEASASAIRGIGTNAFGFCLRKLRRLPGARELQLAVAARRLGFEDLLFRVRGVDSERGQAVTALILLKPLPPGVLSEVVSLSSSSNREIAAAAHRVLITTENELVPLHPAASSQSLDLDLLNLPKLGNFK
jgi:hypothetical protein